MSDNFESGELPSGSVAWVISCDGYSDMVTWAPTIGAARWNWVSLYRDAYGNNRTWPSLSAKRYPQLDSSHLPHRFKRRVISLDEARRWG